MLQLTLMVQWYFNFQEIMMRTKATEAIANLLWTMHQQRQQNDERLQKTQRFPEIIRHHLHPAVFSWKSILSPSRAYHQVSISKKFVGDDCSDSADKEPQTSNVFTKIYTKIPPKWDTVKSPKIRKRLFRFSWQKARPRWIWIAGKKQTLWRNILFVDNKKK